MRNLWRFAPRKFRQCAKLTRVGLNAARPIYIGKESWFAIKEWTYLTSHKVFCVQIFCLYFTEVIESRLALRFSSHTTCPSRDRRFVCWTGLAIKPKDKHYINFLALIVTILPRRRLRHITTIWAVLLNACISKNRNELLAKLQHISHRLIKIYQWLMRWAIFDTLSFRVPFWLLVWIYFFSNNHLIFFFSSPIMLDWVFFLWLVLLGDPLWYPFLVFSLECRLRISAAAQASDSIAADRAGAIERSSG